MHAIARPDRGAWQGASAQYWRRIFRRNADFCSWQTPKQQHVLRALQACLSEVAGRPRVLDFGIGSLGLYRALDETLMRRIALTGISESLQHDPADPLLNRGGVDILIGPGLCPLARVPDASQDRVVCSYVFAYLSEQLRAEALAAFARVMATGAKLVLILHHAQGRRATKFRRTRPYWPRARALYTRLLQGRYAEADALLLQLTRSLDRDFGHDPRHRRYLASYVKTAERFLSVFCIAGELRHEVAEAALRDCERMQASIDRELAMTCDSFQPVACPARDLALPPELTLAGLSECRDPSDGSPIAHVLTAIRRRASPAVQLLASV